MNRVLSKILHEGSAQLTRKKIESSNLDAQILLAHVLGLNRLQLFTTDVEPTHEQIVQYQDLLAQRMTGCPVAYIVGYRHFWKSHFKCDPRALIPRPETEFLVAKASELSKILHLDRSRAFQVLDLCTGTGCVGLSLALEHPTWRITLSDVSQDALELAKENAKQLGVDATFIKSDLFESVEGYYDLITANPPYLNKRETERCLSKGWREPEIALNGGRGGVQILKRLIEEGLDYLYVDGILLWEAAPHQHPIFEKLLQKLKLPLLGPWKDLNNLDRIWGLQKR